MASFNPEDWHSPQWIKNLWTLPILDRTFDVISRPEQLAIDYQISQWRDQKDHD